MTTTSMRRELASLRAEVHALRQPRWPSPLDLAAALGITLDPWQAGALASPERQLIFACARQTGKSLTAALLALWTVLSQPDALVLVVSPSERQSRLLLRTVTRLWQRLGYPVPAQSESRLSLELATGAVIVALPGNERTIRGFSGVSLLIEDEAARCPDELYGAVRPMLAVSGGRIVLLSSPFGMRGHFWREWSEGGPDWHRARITALDCPRIPPAWVWAERDRLGDWLWRQELMAEFVDAEDQLYPTELVEAALRADVTPLGLPRFGEVR